MIHFIKKNKYMSYCILSGLYGSIRSFNGLYDPPNDTLGRRICLALGNGIYYSLYAPYYQLKLFDRIEIKIKGKDPSKYKDSYEDIFSINYNVFL